MEFKWSILLMLLLYLLPELFKRRPKKYEYPEVPAPVPEPEAGPSPAPGSGRQKAEPVRVPEVLWSQPQLKAREGIPMSVTAPPMQVTQLEETTEGWQGHMSQAAVVNGFIFAEILQPPRSRRPLQASGVSPAFRKD